MPFEIDLAGVHTATSQAELDRELQRFVENRGFASFCFVDASSPHLSLPFHVGTDPDWDAEYAQQRFVDVDACLTKARRTNTPFSWRNVPLPERRGRRKPGALRTMEAAQDHGFSEGLVIPFHYVDGVGRLQSMLCSLFYRDPLKDFERTLQERTTEIHLYLLYWMQRSSELRRDVLDDGTVTSFRKAAISLTDRERDVLNWAGRGKTAGETASILGISSETVETHIKNAVARLEAGNKTHAVAKAIMVGVIEP